MISSGECDMWRHKEKSSRSRAFEDFFALTWVSAAADVQDQMSVQAGFWEWQLFHGVSSDHKDKILELTEQSTWGSSTDCTNLIVNPLICLHLNKIWKIKIKIF